MPRAVPQEPAPRTTAFVVGDVMLLVFAWFVFFGEFVFFSRDKVFDVRAVFKDSHSCDED